MSNLPKYLVSSLIGYLNVKSSKFYGDLNQSIEEIVVPKILKVIVEGN
jgi:hypothetical protein